MSRSNAPSFDKNLDAYFQAFFPGATQKLSVTGTHIQTTVLADTTNLVRIVCTTDSHVAFGADPTATTSSLYLPAGTAEYFGVQPGSKVSIIRNSASGDAYVTEGAVL